MSERRIIEYLVKLKNLGDDETSWETADDLKKLLLKTEDTNTRSSRRRYTKWGRVWHVAPFVSSYALCLPTVISQAHGCMSRA